MATEKPTYGELEQRIKELENSLQKELWLSNTRLQLALNSSNIGIHEWNVDNNEFIWDKRVYELAGLPYGTPITLELFIQRVHPDDRERLQNLIDSLSEEGSSGKYFTQFRTNGTEKGIERWLELTGQMYYEKGNATRFIGTIIDITERKRTEETLQKWGDIFHYAKWGIVVDSADAKTIELMNPEFAYMHGYSVEELAGRPIYEVFAPESRDEIFVQIELAHEKGHHIWESVHIRKDGTKFPVLVDITAVKDQNGNVLHRITNVLDITERKNVEKALYESEEHFKQLFQNLNSNFAVHEIVLDENGRPCDYRFLEVNPAMEKATGKKASELIGKTALEIFPDTEPYWIEKFGEVALTGIPASYENYSKELNKYFELLLYSPKKGQFAMIGTDITERKLVEQQIKEAKDFFELLFNLNPDALNITRLSDGHFIDINNGFTNLLGFTREEVLGKTTLELNIWNNPDQRQELFDNLKRKGYYTNLEAIFRRKDGKLLTGITSSKIIDILGVPHILSVTRDISRRKKIEEELKESENALRESQKIAGLGSYKLDFITGVWTSSEILDSIFGIDDSYDKSVKLWEEIIHPEWREQMANYLEKEVVENRNRFDKEYKIIRKKDGRDIWVHGLGELICDEGNTLRYMVGTIQDITERKQAELIIQGQNHELQELNATKDKFFSIIAHDLRSPFSSLMGIIDMLLLDFDEYEKEDIKQILTHISNASGQIYKLLENLLDWSRLQTGQLMPNMEEFNIKPIVEEVFLLYGEMAKRKNIRLSNLIVSDIFVKCDIEMARTILRNLVSNAIKFTNYEGVVIVDGCRKESVFEIQIKDTGVGIPTSKIPYLFHIEKNTTTNGTADEKGTGLGLLLCKELIEKQGGEIRVESEVGKGSTFYFSLPCNTD